MEEWPSVEGEAAACWLVCMTLAGEQQLRRERSRTPFIKHHGNHLDLDPEELRSLKRLLVRGTFESFRNAVGDTPQRDELVGGSGDTAAAI